MRIYLLFDINKLNLKVLIIKKSFFFNLSKGFVSANENASLRFLYRLLYIILEQKYIFETIIAGLTVFKVLFQLVCCICIPSFCCGRLEID